MSERPRPWLRANNFGEVCAEALRVDPGWRAITGGDRELTYAQLEERARRFAGLLPSLGVSPGDTVALATGNNWRFVESFLGTLMAGAVALLVNVKLSSETLAYISGHSDARLIVADAALGDRIAAMATGSPGLKSILAIGDGLKALDYDRALESARPVDEVRPTDPDSLALLMYTSGSTGRPKGCMLSHSNTWWQARSSARCMLLDRSDTGLVMGPLYHANALWAILLPMIFVGGGVVILPQFEPRSVLETIERHGVTYTSGTPSMYSLLLADPDIDRFDVSSINLLQCGSAPVQEELMTRIRARFEGDVVETYGLTEAGANVLTPRWGIKKLGSTGLPVPDVEIKITAPDHPDRECAPGDVGELWSRSPANALGYLHEPGLTAERFWPEGWMRTGDLMRRDEQGYCYFSGRTDDMINVGGEHVYPKEVETIVLSHPAVADVAVVPALHPVKGYAPVAFVVLKSGGRATEDEIKQHFLANGPAYAHPRRVFFTDSLPLSSTNKLDRGALKTRASELLPDGLEARR
ncbi:MAG: class I adenylate-forming enzyme family protein [Candidatus Dormibacteraceae bacterium]